MNIGEEGASPWDGKSSGSENIRNVADTPLKMSQADPRTLRVKVATDRAQLLVSNLDYSP